jgi:hypothetical protein
MQSDERRIRRRPLILSAAILCGLISGTASSQSPRSILTRAFTKEVLDARLLSRRDWHPFPKASEREAWEALPGELKERLVTAGEKYLNCKWPELPATLFLQYKRNGNRENYENRRDARRKPLESLVLAECVEGRGRFLDDVVNGIWSICEESYWGVPAHVGMQRSGAGLPDTSEPTVDLFAGETTGLLSWTDYLLASRLDSISPLIPRRIEREIVNRVLTPCLDRNDFGWMGFGDAPVNNWNPWINSNWLASALLTEPDPGRRSAAVLKIVASLDRFLDTYPDDGGCEEGPGYWSQAGASLFDCLELLAGSTGGAVGVYEEPLVREIARYIYRVQIADGYFINFGDASARSGAPADLVYRFGTRIGDRPMRDLGLSLRELGDWIPESGMERRLAAIFGYREFRDEPPARPPLPRDVWLKDIQVMAARSKAGETRGLYLAVKGAHNGESHNHNDVGNFIVYRDGRPVLIDVGVEAYTAKTFSSERYDIWTMQSAFHNCPTVNRVMQGAGRRFEAREVEYAEDDGKAEISMDIAAAYPPEARLRTWKRTFRLVRDGEVVIEDRYALTGPVEDMFVTLMTPCGVEIVRPGDLLLVERGVAGPPAGVHLEYDSEKLSVTTEDIPIEDRGMKKDWGSGITRILLRAKSPSLQDQWRIRIPSGG